MKAMAEREDARIRDCSSGDTGESLKDPVCSTPHKSPMQGSSPCSPSNKPKGETMSKSAFERELKSLINRESMEQYSDTPDFILAEYIMSCLETFRVSVRAREKWYGRPEPSEVDITGGHTKPKGDEE
jgi:hypothetical protein